MDLIWDGLCQAFRLLFTGDAELWRIALLTLRVSGLATLLSILVGVPLGVGLAMARFPGLRFLMALVNTGMGMPPVVVGLWVTILFWRSGPLGAFGLMYTPTAMVIAQCVIALPVITAFTAAGVAQLDPKLVLQIRSLGASRWQLLLLIVREARLSVLAAVIAGFGGVVSEVGASMMVGGNILGQTRVLTTSIVMEVSRGNFAVALGLSVMLLFLTFLVVAGLTVLQRRGQAP
jgi:tungstate transport system permease protein